MANLKRLVLELSEFYKYNVQAFAGQLHVSIEGRPCVISNYDSQMVIIRLYGRLADPLLALDRETVLNKLKLAYPAFHFSVEPVTEARIVIRPSLPRYDISTDVRDEIVEMSKIFDRIESISDGMVVITDSAKVAVMEKLEELR